MDTLFREGHLSHAKTLLLCEQAPPGSKNPLFPFREGHLSHHTRHEKAPPLLPGPHFYHPHLIAFASFAPEVKLHGESGKVGDWECLTSNIFLKQP